jgi:hypothetical protein
MFAIAVSSPLEPAQDVAQVVGWRKAMSLEQSVSQHYTHGSLEAALLDAVVDESISWPPCHSRAR